MNEFLGNGKCFSAFFALKPLRSNSGLPMRAVFVAKFEGIGIKNVVDTLRILALGPLISGYKYAEILSITSFIPLLLFRGGSSKPETNYIYIYYNL
ncbi:MAG: hypothetical protein EG822_14340 [Deltaproteobacteria bacterium]|nr:hypothetical protein [Deltaproteobacteria bacterium]TLN02154.1 MAG: hypothetical protein FDZ73_12820 [bacterium]